MQAQMKNTSMYFKPKAGSKEGQTTPLKDTLKTIERTEGDIS